MTDTKAPPTTVAITVDGKEIQAVPGEPLIDAAKRAGIYIPYFCYHPRMDPVGACRMCLVDVEGSPPIPGTQQRRPQTSCTTTVREGMVVHTQFTSEEINTAQKTILELLLINHPLDCPICDRGGECPLQDQVQDYGSAESKFTEPKRRYEKPVPISPLINLDRERCILCYRCTRFCEELSGDVLIGVMERGPDAFIFPYYEGAASGPHTHDGDGVRGPSASNIKQTFDSYFSGNTVQICPVGALTSTEYRFQARPWDLQVMDTTCNLCASGCSLHAGVRVQDGRLSRFSAATNEDTNEEWLCDKGRFGNGYISETDRLTYSYLRKGNELAPVSWDETFKALEDGLKPVIDGERPAAMIIGESLCDEDAYVAQKFARVVLKTNDIDHRIDGGLEADALVRPTVTYDDVLSAGLVVLVGFDTREELPLLFLRMRIAATKRDLKIAVVHQRDVALSEYAVAQLKPLPGDEARAALDVSSALDGGTVPDDVRTFADALRGATNAVILLGPRMHAPATIGAWQTVAGTIGAKLSWAPRRAGTNGAIAAGAHPALLPGYRRIDDESARGQVASAWGTDVPATPGRDVRAILEAAAAGEIGALWLVGADVLADSPDLDLARRALEATPFVVVQDVRSTQLMNFANVVLPAAAFVERNGTLTDWEGRRQKVNAAVDPPGTARADYAILAEAARRLGRPIGCRTSDAAGKELDDLLASAGTAEQRPAAAPPATPAGGNGDLRLLTYRLLYDAGSRIAQTAGISELTSDPFVEIAHADADRLGISDGAQVTVRTEHGSLSLPAQVSKTLRPGAVFVPTNQPGANALTLCSWDDRNPTVTLETT